ncbi:MAG: rhodanese-like domain-containing protein [Pyrinomonadaceae bacterium]|nr:rhodanese-like domain-containing protein [Pyrinomonadaceae bacterium]
MRMTLFFTLILSIFAFSACQTASTEKASDNLQTDIKQISVEQAKQSVDGKDAQFIDVRTTEEYAGGHAPKAANFPLDALEKDLAKLDKDKPVYLICQTGRRSQKGAEILQKAGFKNIYNIQGGTSAWTGAGFPTEK